MKLGAIHGTPRLRWSESARSLVVDITRTIEFEESDNVKSIGLDMQKAVTAIKTLMRQNAQLTAQINALRQQLADEQAKPTGIATDDATDAALADAKSFLDTLPTELTVGADPSLPAAVSVAAPPPSSPLPEKP